jgi:hypothetical protein
MATHTHPHPLLTLRRFVVGHPYAADWLLLMVGTLAGLLLWFWKA